MPTAAPTRLHGRNGGIGTFKIAHMLEEQGVPTRKGSAWAASTVKGILTNEKYYGAAMFQKTYTDSSFAFANVSRLIIAG